MSAVNPINHHELQDLYLNFHQLFGMESETLKTRLKEANAGAVPQDAAQTAESTSQNFLAFFIRITGLGMELLDGSTMTSIGRNIVAGNEAETSAQIFDSFRVLSGLGLLLGAASLMSDFANNVQQKRFLLAQGLWDPRRDIVKESLNEAFKQNRTSLLCATVAITATVLTSLPDPTFFTKVAATSLFLFLSFHGAIKQAMAAHESSKMIQAIQNNPRPLLEKSDAKKLSYQEFLEQIIQKNPENKFLMSAFLSVGDELKKADFDFTKTTLSQNQWHELAIQTLKFKRSLQVLNSLRGFVLGIATGLMMIPIALTLLTIKTAQAIGVNFDSAKAVGTKLCNLLGAETAFTFTFATIAKLAQHFSQKSLFQRFILNKTDFSGSIVYVKKVFDSEQLKKLESTMLLEEIKTHPKSKVLSGTVKILKNLKENDRLLSDIRGLKQKIEEFKQSDRSQLRFSALQEIERLIPQHLKYVEKIFDTKDAEKLGSKSLLLMIKIHPQSKALSATIKALKNLKDNNPLFAKHPGLKNELEAFKLLNRDSDRLEALINIGKIIHTIPEDKETLEASSTTIPKSPLISRESSQEPLLSTAEISTEHLLNTSEGVSEFKGEEHQTPTAFNPPIDHADKAQASMPSFSKAEIKDMLRDIKNAPHYSTEDRQAMKDLLRISGSRITLHQNDEIHQKFQEIKDHLQNARRRSTAVPWFLLSISRLMNPESTVSMTSKEVKKAKTLLKTLEKGTPDKIAHEIVMETLNALEKISVHPSQHSGSNTLATEITKLKEKLAQETHDPQDIEGIKAQLLEIHTELSPHLETQRINQNSMTFFSLASSQNAPTQMGKNPAI